MNFNRHSELEGQHAFLSPSQNAWTEYSMEKLRSVYFNRLAVIEGTELHRIAKDLIDHRIKMPKTKDSFNAYINDAIGYNMSPEVVLKYSKNCFGTADAISCNNKILRIHDLKTGSGRVSMRQLEVYESLFFLEYGPELNITPYDLEAELRIYQRGNPIVVHKPEPDYICKLMEHIKLCDNCIDQFKTEGRL